MGLKRVSYTASLLNLGYPRQSGASRASLGTGERPTASSLREGLNHDRDHAVWNVHREGILAHASLLSMAKARHIAEAAGITVEVIAVADCSSDRATLDTLAEAADVQVLETSVDDLGLARNVGVAARSEG